MEERGFSTGGWLTLICFLYIPSSEGTRMALVWGSWLCCLEKSPSNKGLLCNEELRFPRCSGTTVLKEKQTD